MFSMTKSRELNEVQSKDGDANKRHYGEDVKFYLKIYQKKSFVQQCETGVLLNIYLIFIHKVRQITFHLSLNKQR